MSGISFRPQRELHDHLHVYAMHDAMVQVAMHSHQLRWHACSDDSSISIRAATSTERVPRLCLAEHPRACKAPASPSEDLIEIAKINGTRDETRWTEKLIHCVSRRSSQRFNQCRPPALLHSFNDVLTGGFSVGSSFIPALTPFVHHD